MGDRKNRSDNFAPENEEHTEVLSEERLELMRSTGSVTSVGGKYCIHCMSIIGQVEGHQVLPPQNKSTKYEHLMPQLVAVEQSDEIEGLIILLNTVGGDVEAGLALAELIAGMRKPTVSLVLGGGHSIGVPLAVSAKQSFIVPSATMTIHPVRTSGLVLGVPQTLDYFERMQNRITGFVAANSRMEPERFLKLSRNTGELVTDIGTVLDGQQAVDEGLIDHLGSLSDAIESLYDQIKAAKKTSSRSRRKKNTDGEEGQSPKETNKEPKQ